MDFAISEDDQITLKEDEKSNKYLELTCKLKNLWKMVTVTTILIGAFKTITKGLVRGLEELNIRGWVETIQTIALWR